LKPRITIESEANTRIVAGIAKRPSVSPLLFSHRKGRSVGAHGNVLFANPICPVKRRNRYDPKQKAAEDQRPRAASSSASSAHARMLNRRGKQPIPKHELPAIAAQTGRGAGAGLNPALLRFARNDYRSASKRMRVGQITFHQRSAARARK